MATKKAAFGAGCFWGVEEAFRTLAGVKETAVGYMGGSTYNPTYKEVCTDRTGHAEVVQVAYDPEEISYAALLEAFWNCHDATQVNRQGHDVGTQYRSVIFCHDEKQKKAAQESKKKQQQKNGKAIATAIVQAKEFWRAEEYHQKYLMRRGINVCH